MTPPPTRSYNPAMLPRDRVKLALAHQEPPPGDRPPFHVQVLPDVERALCAATGLEDPDRALGHDMCWLSVQARHDPGPVQPNGRPTWIDDFGVVWEENPHDRGAVIVAPLAGLNPPTLQDFPWPEVDHEARTRHLAEKCARYADLYRMCWIGDLFERFHFLRGLEDALCDLLIHQDFVEEFFARRCQDLERNMEAAATYPVDGFFLSDDYGSQDRMLMSPNTWREIIRPHVARLAEKSHCLGRPFFLHSCGHLEPIVEDLAEIGVDALHPVQAEANDAAAVKRRVGRRLTIFGGISTQRLLRTGTPEAVRREVARVRETLGTGGGFILAPSISVQADVPLANLRAFLEAASLLSPL